jgi:AmmeMemoRadiSam system protein A
MTTTTTSLSETDRRWLLALARRTLERLAPTGATVPQEHLLIEGDVPAATRQPRGAFVSLHTPGGDLRGCIGYVLPVGALYRAVIENAVNAARRDPRFPPVAPREVAGLRIEVSAMGAPMPVKDIEEIEVGRDGLILSDDGAARGLLLPQVATEYGWDRETFLDQTCRKAGLPFGAWRHGAARIERFSAEVFGE